MLMDKYKVTHDPSGVVWFTINRPEKRNAIDYDVMSGLEKTIEEVSYNNDAKALVITGSGDKAFCAGGDLEVFHDLRTKTQAYSMLSRMGSILYSLLCLSKPTVALINGTCIGGGAELATACDYRISSSTSKIGFVQGRLGITTGWGGASMLLEKMKYDQAMEMLMSANTYKPEKALQLGFIHKVIESDKLVEECNSFLLPYLSKGTQVLSAYKMVAVRKWDATFKERMFAEIERCAFLWETDEHHEAVESFLQGK
jgi:enoyl-CoA hydratase